MYKTYFYFIIFFILIAYISSDGDSPSPEIICSLNKDCNSCTFCGNRTSDYSQCNFENIFCHYDQNNNYEYNTNFKAKYSNFFHQDAEINSFCGEQTIHLDSIKKSFTILDSTFNYNLLSKKINCDYDIINKYYYNHETDQAKLHLEIKKLADTIDESEKIKFNIYLIYETEKSIKFSNFTDNNLRNNQMNRTLDGISNLEILIDFKHDINHAISIKEYLEINIITENPSLKNKIIIIIISVICGFLLLSIIVLIIIYILIKRKMANHYRDNGEEEREKEEKFKNNKELIEKLYKTILKAKIYNKELLVNNCENCSICTDNFEIGKSEVMITPCKHIFHYNCLKPWIDSKILEPKCPNCNSNILNGISLKSLENAEPQQIEVIKKNDENNNSNNRNHDSNNNNNPPIVSDIIVINNNISDSNHIEIGNNLPNSNDMLND